MISYELAKQLKDAGFPGSENWVLIEGENAKPILSELIEVCGKELFVLFSRPDAEIESKRCKVQCMMNHRVDTTWGKTPEEAVAHAWLSLNSEWNAE